MKNKIYVWDYMVRFFHWTLVLVFTIAYLTGEELDLIHAYAGYYIIGLIMVRIVWGFVGSKYARFSQFIASPRAAITYMKELVSSKDKKNPTKGYIGHNPAGGWMVIGLLISILATSYSGLKVYGLEGSGPLAITAAEHSQVQQPSLIKVSDSEEHDNEQDEEFWEEIHEFLANFTVLLIFLHVGGVLLSSHKHKQNLVKSMVTGYKKTNP